jgi:hypothetical protein
MSIDDFKDDILIEYKEGFLDGTVKTQEDYDKAEWIKVIYYNKDKPYIERALTGKNAQNGLLGIRLV